MGNPSGASVFFANTHGPLGNCGNTVGNNWLGGVNENKQAGDTVFMTGDFNCGTGTPAMNILKGQLRVAVDGGIDQILSDQGNKNSGGKREGSPSDHPLIKGSFTVKNNGGGGSPRRRRRASTGGQGSGSCQDGNGQCSYWASTGECTRNPQYMRANCKKSCNACSGSGGTSTGSSCNDSNNQCTYWASTGECARNPQYMKVNCKKSCN